VYKTKQVRRKEAEERQLLYSKLTVEQKIKRLDEQFGINIGAKKERAKLTKKVK